MVVQTNHAHSDKRDAADYFERNVRQCNAGKSPYHFYSDFIQVLLPVIEEIPVDPVIIGIFITNPPDRAAVKAVYLRLEERRGGAENGHR